MNLKQTLLTVTAAAGLFGMTTIAANADTVTVKAGDTVSGIAAANHTTVAAIEKANELADVNFILPGQKLDIDGEGKVKVVEQPQQVQAPVQAQTAVQPKAPVQKQAPVKTQAPIQSSTPAASSSLNGSEAAAKAAIANRESGGSYTATNGQFYGKYQLDKSMLNGDYSAANQEKVADQYAIARYGSWQGALKHSNQFGWY